MDKLEEIMDWKRREISSLIRPVNLNDLEKIGQRMQTDLSFKEALAGNDLSVIAEIKRKSPSAGNIAEGASAIEQARTYLNANADALSILTDKKYFGGKLEDLWDVNDFLSNHKREIPTLRKDFMLHPVQVLEALEAGARAILLIVRALSNDELKILREAADAGGIDCLYEIHEMKELEKALRHEPKIIGVNNRDLTRFVTDLKISEDLIPQIPDSIIKVSESGIFEAEDAWTVREFGADAVLCGEALMKSEDVESLIHVMKEKD